ncbi:MAG: hypothetical protein ACQEWU_17335 [Bacillota bacterium]|nr:MULTISPECIES: hypothetical protein [Bacillaceae]MDY7045409.1 hypothetical protein [Virgibacillus sp. M23]WBX79991.1 hypothetical protein PD280_20635 [Virgibacillus salarius]
MIKVLMVAEIKEIVKDKILLGGAGMTVRELKEKLQVTLSVEV